MLNLSDHQIQRIVGGDFELLQINNQRNNVLQELKNNLDVENKKINELSIEENNLKINLLKIQNDYDSKKKKLDVMEENHIMHFLKQQREAIVKEMMEIKNKVLVFEIKKDELIAEYKKDNLFNFLLKNKNSHSILILALKKIYNFDLAYYKYSVLLELPEKCKIDFAEKNNKMMEIEQKITEEMQSEQFALVHQMDSEKNIVEMEKRKLMQLLQEKEKTEIFINDLEKEIQTYDAKEDSFWRTILANIQSRIGE